MTKSLQDYYKDLGQSESSGRYNIENNCGYLGKYQMGAQALEEAGYYKRSDEEKRTGKNLWNGTFTGKDGVYSKDDYLRNAKAQDNAVNEYNKSQWMQIKSNDNRGDKYIGKTINGIVITPSGLLAAAHLKGPGGSSAYYKTNGREIPADRYGTTAEERMYKFRDYDVSEITGIPHKEYDTFENYLKNKGKGDLLGKNPNIEKRNKKEFEGKTEPKFVTEANKWNEEIQKEAKEYNKHKEDTEKEIKIRKERIKNKTYTSNLLPTNNNKISSNETFVNKKGPYEILFRNLESNGMFKDTKVLINGKKPTEQQWKNLVEGYSEKLDGVRYSDNRGKGPNGEDGYWYTTKQGKHIFVPDDKTA